MNPHLIDLLEKKHPSISIEFFIEISIGRAIFSKLSNAYKAKLYADAEENIQNALNEDGCTVYELVPSSEVIDSLPSEEKTGGMES